MEPQPHKSATSKHKDLLDLNMADKQKYVPVIKEPQYVPVVKVGSKKAKASPSPKPANKSTREYGAQRAEQKRRDKVVNTLIDLIALESRSEGVPGMAVVAKSILNRKKYIEEGKDWEGFPVYKNAYWTKGKSDIMSIITAKDQYEPMNPDGTLRYDDQDPLTQQDRDQSRMALNIALNDQEYAKMVEATGLPQEAFYASGFRTKTAKDDPSQNVGNFIYKNHIFNTATGTEKPSKK